MKPSFKIISAKPGEPSILWIGKSGMLYRTLVQAKTDKPENAYLPPENKPEKPAVTKNLSNKEIAVLVVIVVILAALIYKLID